MCAIKCVSLSLGLASIVGKLVELNCVPHICLPPLLAAPSEAQHVGAHHMQADNRIRAWYMSNMAVGLLYECNLGDIKPDCPVGERVVLAFTTANGQQLWTLR